MVWLILGTAVGLLLAHWLAFRLAARITTEQGGWTPSAAQEAAAQLAGGLAVAVLAAAPFLLLDGTSARVASLAVTGRAPRPGGLPDRPAPRPDLAVRPHRRRPRADPRRRRRRRQEHPRPLGARRCPTPKSDPPKGSTTGTCRTPGTCSVPLRTDKDRGLSTPVAAARLARYGPNTLRPEAKPSRLRIALGQLRGPDDPDAARRGRGQHRHRRRAPPRPS